MAALVAHGWREGRGMRRGQVVDSGQARGWRTHPAALPVPAVVPAATHKASPYALRATLPRVGGSSRPQSARTGTHKEVRQALAVLVSSRDDNVVGAAPARVGVADGALVAGAPAHRAASQAPARAWRCVSPLESPLGAACHAMRAAAAAAAAAAAPPAARGGAQEREGAAGHARAEAGGLGGGGVVGGGARLARDRHFNVVRQACSLPVAIAAGSAHHCRALHSGHAVGSLL